MSNSATGATLIKRCRDRKFWTNQVAEYELSGQSPQDYCQHHHLCPSQLKRWRYRLKKEKQQQGFF